MQARPIVNINIAKNQSEKKMFEKDMAQSDGSFFRRKKKYLSKQMWRFFVARKKSVRFNYSCDQARWCSNDDKEKHQNAIYKESISFVCQTNVCCECEPEHFTGIPLIFWQRQHSSTCVCLLLLAYCKRNESFWRWLVFHVIIWKNNNVFPSFTWLYFRLVFIQL